jgi:hypothetical protein
VRDARYVRLISWTLQSGSEQFIYNWNQDQPTQTWTKKLARRNGQDSNGNKWMGLKVVSKVTCNRQDKKNLDNGIKWMGYKSCQELHANRQDNGNGIKRMGYKLCQESHASRQD